MSWLLALDTTNEIGSLALLANGEVVEEVVLQSSEGFGAIIFTQIESLLARHELQPDDIECFAGATGPGSFTGVRVGLTVVKALGEFTGRPVVGVSNLQAMASFGSAPLRAVLLDARRGEIFGAVYDSHLQPVQDETVIPAAQWLADLPTGDLELISQEATLLVGRPLIQSPRSLAAAIGKIAWNEFTSGHALDPAALDANYVRRSDAEMLWKEMA